MREQMLALSFAVRKSSDALVRPDCVEDRIARRLHLRASAAARATHYQQEDEHSARRRGHGLTLLFACVGGPLAPRLLRYAVSDRASTGDRP